MAETQTNVARVRPEDLAPRYELSDLLPRDLLSGTLETLVRIARVAGGVVRNPLPGQSIPNDPQLFPEWRITDVVGYDRNGNRVPGGSLFCRSIRAIEGGNKECMIADLVNANTAYAERKALPYLCDPATLKDIVAPIVVGGHHLANIYLGQVRPKDADFRAVWEKYRLNLAPMSPNFLSAKVSEAQLKEEFEDLWAEDELTIPVESLCDMLTRIAGLISHQAAARAILKLWSELSVELAHGLDVRQAMLAIFLRSSHILRFSSGSIVTREGDTLESQAYLYPDVFRTPLRFPVDSEKGIVPYVFQRSVPVIRHSRCEIDQLRIPNFETSRDQRRLQSMLAVPIVVEGRTVGVFEIGDTEPNVYRDDDLEVLMSLADFAGLHVRLCSDFRTLNSILQARGTETILEKFKDAIPALVHGTACSIFLRRSTNSVKHRSGLRAGFPAVLTEQAFLVATIDICISNAIQ